MEALIFTTLVVPLLLMFYGGFLLFIRPSKAIWLRSLLAGLVVGGVNFVIDVIAYYAHWWHYQLVAITMQQANATSSYQQLAVNIFGRFMIVLHVPLPFYLTPVLIYGSLISLLVWRFRSGKGRWFSWLLLIGTPIFCIVRDIVGGLQKSSYQVWENVPMAIIATIVMWLAAFYLGYLVFKVKADHMPYVPDAEDNVAKNVSAEVQAVQQS